MFSSYVMSGIRNAVKNRLNLLVNVLGLSIGLSGLIFTQILVEYEATHDAFFEKASRTYSIYPTINPEMDLGLRSLNGVQTAVGPLLESGFPEIEAVARYSAIEMIVGVGDNTIFQWTQAADPAFLQIFDLDYVEGADTADLSEPFTAILTETAAAKIFSGGPAYQQIFTLDNKVDVRVVAIVRDLPSNSHFSYTLITEEEFGVLFNIDTLEATFESDRDYANWDNLNVTDRTYLLLPADYDAADLESQLNPYFKEHADENVWEIIDEFKIRPLVEMNGFLWDATGLPVMEAISLFGFLILLIAIINYTNLAGAKALLRAREVGVRKAAGATRGNLAVQFLIEAVLESLLAFIVAIILITLAVPVFNDATGKVLTFDFGTDIGLTVQFLIISVSVGLIAGAYPAFLLSGIGTVRALKGVAGFGRSSSYVRSTMVVVQFTVSIVLIVAAVVSYAQNVYTQTRDLGFNGDNMLVVMRTNTEEARAVIDVMKDEIRNIPGVTHVAGSSQTPYMQSNSQRDFSRSDVPGGDEVRLHYIGVDYDFIDTYRIEMIAGRNFSKAFTDDLFELDVDFNPLRNRVNVLVSRLTTERFGWNNPEEAIGQVLVNIDEDGEGNDYEATIVGVTDDFHMLAFHNSLKPIIYMNTPVAFSNTNIRTDGKDMQRVTREVDEIWQRMMPNTPMERRFLTEIFDIVNVIFESINLIVVAFSILALFVACIGLYGLSAFMAELQTKEVGVRRVLGGSLADVSGRLAWRFVRPAIIAAFIGIPLGYLASQQYLNFFTDSVFLNPLYFIGAGVFVCVLAALTVSSHALRVGMTAPVRALRYE